MTLLEEAMLVVQGEYTQDPVEVRLRLDELYSKAKGMEKIQIGQLDEVIAASDL